MQPSRPTNEQDRFSLKASFRQLLKRAGGQEAAELVTRGRHQTLNRYGNPKEEDCHAPIDVIADLEKEIGDAIVTRHLADIAGYLLVKKTIASASSCLITHLATFAMESGQTIKALAAGADDQQWDDEELTNIVKEAREAREAAAAVELAAQARLDARRKGITPIRPAV